MCLHDHYKPFNDSEIFNIFYSYYVPGLPNKVTVNLYF